MSVIKLTAADILKNKTLEPGYFGAEIVKFVEKPSKDKDSINYVFTFRLEDTDGKELDRYYNSKAIGMIVDLYQAVSGKKVEPADLQFDPEDLLHKKIDVKIVVELYEGRPVNKIDSFLPYGAAKSAPAF